MGAQRMKTRAYLLESIHKRLDDDFEAKRKTMWETIEARMQKEAKDKADAAAKAKEKSEAEAALAAYTASLNDESADAGPATIEDPLLPKVPKPMERKNTMSLDAR